MSLPRMYTLGSSPLFLLVSHEIAKLSEHPKSIPNLILLLSDPLKLKRFLNNDSRISIGGNNEPTFQYMAACTPPALVTEDKVIIDNLVVVEKNKQKLLTDLNQYKGSLKGKSNVLLINPPMGIFEMLWDSIWKENERQLMPNIFVGLTDKDEAIVTSNRSPNNPNLILNSNNNLVKRNREFSVNLNPMYWNSKIRLLVTRAPNQFDVTKSPTSTLLLNQLTKNNDLTGVMNKLDRFNTSYIEFTDFQFLRLERTIIDGCVESLAALYDCKYIHELLIVKNVDHLLRTLIREQIYVTIRSYPHLIQSTNCNVILSEDRIFELIMMKLKDLKVKSKAFKYMNRLDIHSINDLNSYFIDLGYKNKIYCKWNIMLNSLLKGKTTIKKESSTANTYM
ncbi:hypothetical protein C6P44_004911 [Monosporozyma unispora]|nr:hypothetical protein C6P44_004911 [Kazachstania unispora]